VSAILLKLYWCPVTRQAKQSQLSVICSNKNSGAIHVQALIVKLSIGVYCSLLSLLLSRPSLGGHCHWMPQKKLAMDGDFPTDRRVSLSSQLQSTSGGISRQSPAAQLSARDLELPTHAAN